MNKAIALKKMKIAIENYEIYLKNYEYLILFQDNEGSFQFKKIIFSQDNFHHLTGTKIEISAKSFYERLLNSKLGINDFEFKSDGTTTLKLEIIENYHKLFYSSCHIGDYDSNNYINTRLSTDSIIGKHHICLGLKSVKTYYKPNTLLKEKIKPLVFQSYPVICTLKRHISCENYEFIYLKEEHSEESIKEIFENRLQHEIVLKKVESKIKAKDIRKNWVAQINAIGKNSIEDLDASDWEE